MSRREYKAINRRLQAGKAASIREGKYPGSLPPYGYERVKLRGEKGYTLTPIREQADTVQHIYHWFTEGFPFPDGSLQKIGPSLIAKKLNAMGRLPARALLWSESSIRDILQNPVYIGKLRWERRKTKKAMEDGQMVVSRPRQTEYLLTDGLHPPIISPELFASAQSRFHSSSSHSRSSNELSRLKNPFAGILKCGICGHTMVMRNTGRKLTLLCPYHCGNVSSYFGAVEDRILLALEQWFENYRLDWNAASPVYTDEALFHTQKLLASRQAELRKETLCLERICELLEKQIYTPEQFLLRQKQIQNHISEIQDSITDLQSCLQHRQGEENEKGTEVVLPDTIANLYRAFKEPWQKNALLKEVLEKIVYIKRAKNKRGEHEDAFLLECYPRLPKQPVSDKGQSH